MRRLGKFTIGRSTIDDRPAEALAMLAGSLVVRAELIYPGYIEYLALNDAFDELEPGYEVPLYIARLNRDLDGTVQLDAWVRASQ